jgi:hypothetical protein
LHFKLEVRYAHDKTVTFSGFELLQEVEGGVDGIKLSIADIDINLSSVMRGLMRAKGELEAYLMKEYGFAWPDD